MRTLFWHSRNKRKISSNLFYQLLLRIQFVPCILQQSPGIYHRFLIIPPSPGGILGYKRDGGGGGGGVRRIFVGLKFSLLYFFGSEKSARIFLGSNFFQANSSYAIQAKVPARSERQKGSIFRV